MVVTYTTAPKGSDFWDWVRGSDHIPRTVHEAERRPIETGLLDARGNKIMRVEAPNPIGFVTFQQGNQHGHR